MNCFRALPLLVLGLAATSAVAQEQPATAPAAEAAPATTPERAPRSRGEAAATWTEDGLAKVEIAGLDVVYARADASLQGYDSVLLRPISVAFRRGWERGDTARRRISTTDAQRIKDRLSGLMAEEMSKALGAGGYVLSAQPGDTVLELELRVTDLYIAAPDLRVGGRTDVYAVSAGEMTLIAELRDSTSGETLMRIYDHEEGTTSMNMHRITNAENEAEARQVVGEWANVLRGMLDLAKGRPQN